MADHHQTTATTTASGGQDDRQRRQDPSRNLVQRHVGVLGVQLLCGSSGAAAFTRQLLPRTIRYCTRARIGEVLVPQATASLQASNTQEMP